MSDCDGGTDGGSDVKRVLIDTCTDHLLLPLYMSTIPPNPSSLSSLPSPSPLSNLSNLSNKYNKYNKIYGVDNSLSSVEGGRKNLERMVKAKSNRQYVDVQVVYGDGVKPFLDGAVVVGGGGGGGDTDTDTDTGTGTGTDTDTDDDHVFYTTVISGVHVPTIFKILSPIVQPTNKQSTQRTERAARAARAARFDQIILSPTSTKYEALYSLFYDRDNGVMKNWDFTRVYCCKEKDKCGRFRFYFAFELRRGFWWKDGDRGDADNGGGDADENKNENENDNDDDVDKKDKFIKLIQSKLISGEKEFQEWLHFQNKWMKSDGRLHTKYGVIKR
jgi:hypothetical protein